MSEKNVQERAGVSVRRVEDITGRQKINMKQLQEAIEDVSTAGLTSFSQRLRTNFRIIMNLAHAEKAVKSYINSIINCRQ